MKQPWYYVSNNDGSCRELTRFPERRSEHLVLFVTMQEDERAAMRQVKAWQGELESEFDELVKSSTPKDLRTYKRDELRQLIFLLDR